MNETINTGSLPGPGIAIQVIDSVIFFGTPVALLVMIVTTIYVFARAANRVRSHDADYKVITIGAQLTWWLSATIATLALFVIFATNFFFDAGNGIGL